MSEIIIKTTKTKEVVDITDKVQEVVKIESGVINLFLTHTTAALTTADLDPGGTDQDYLDAFGEMVPNPPAGGKYRHPHNPEHMPDHILSTLIGTSLTLPVQNGQLALGTWQRVVLIEFDGPRERKILFSTS